MPSCAWARDRLYFYIRSFGLDITTISNGKLRIRFHSTGVNNQLKLLNTSAIESGTQQSSLVCTVHSVFIQIAFAIVFRALTVYESDRGSLSRGGLSTCALSATIPIVEHTIWNKSRGRMPCASVQNTLYNYHIFISKHMHSIRPNKWRTTNWIWNHFQNASAELIR